MLSLLRKISLINLILVSCSTPSFTEVASKYEILRGKLATEPVLESEGERLFIYLDLESSDGSKSILVCLAANTDNKRILSEVRELLLKAYNEPVFIYASKSNGTFKEIVKGIDYEIYAVGVYTIEAKKYRVILTGYGENLKTALSSVSWSEFLAKVLKKGLDSVL